MTEPPNPLLQQAVSGDRPELSRLAAQGLLPVAEEELVPVQVAFARGDDPELARLARESLEDLPPQRLAELVRQGAPSTVLAWAAETGNPVAVEAVVRRRDVPRTLLVALASRLAAPLQEILLLRQDAILEQPTILDALETNPDLSSYARRRIAEYREHLLPQEKKKVAPTEEPEEDEEGPSAAEVEAALEAARKVEASGEVDEETGLSDSQIRALPIPVRVKLARSGSKSLRKILIRDPNPQVALAVFAGPTLSEQEVEKIASNRGVIGDVLEAISRRRDWIGKYRILSAVVHNPRTPLPVALKLVNRLAVRDLSNLARDRNVAEPVRSTAQRLYRMKQR